MAESKVDRNNFIVLQGWMISDLKLKGNELIIYACIYGFSQVANQSFTGSIQYLADWANCTKRSVINALNALIKKDLIEKKVKIINNVKFCEYRVKNFTGVVKKVHQGSENNSPGVVKNFHQGSEKSSPNNIEDNIEDSIEDKKIYITIVSYLNDRAGTNYKASSKNTKEHIHARLADGFTVDDFKTVIDKKCNEWIGTDFEKYLRPATLFGTKFESYLNANVATKKAHTSKEDAIRYRVSDVDNW